MKIGYRTKRSRHFTAAKTDRLCEIIQRKDQNQTEITLKSDMDGKPI